MSRGVVTLTVGGLLAGWMLSLGVLYTWQDALIFPGAHMRIDGPQPAHAPGLGWTVHVVARADAPNLQLWHRPAPEGVPVRGALVMLAGNAGHPLQFQEHAKDANARGWHVVSPVYRGFSGTEGHPDQAGVVADADTAWTWAVQTLDVDPDDVVIHGHSLGGGVAAQLAARRRPPLLVLSSSFDSLRAMLQRRYPYFPVGLTLAHPFETATALQDFDGALLLLHAEDDPIVPVDGMRRLAAQFPQATVLVTPTGGHEPPVAISPDARAAWLAALDAVP